MTLRTTLLAAAALIGLSAPAFAVPISGAYQLTVNTVTTDTVNSADASKVMFSGGGTTPPNTLTSFTPVAGFTPTLTACSTCGTINNITVTPFTAINPLFTVQGLSFALNTLTYVGRNSGGGGSSLELRGTGTYTAAGYDATGGVFDITIQNNTGFINTSASASGAAIPTPEPMSLALLGGGLAALGLVRRKR